MLLIARVLAQNYPSLAACRHAGFVPVEYGTDEGRSYVRLERRLDPAVVSAHG